MKLKWLGHSCFQLTSDNGIKVVTDPFDESVGYPVPDAEADIVTMSHEHHDHSNSKCVHGKFVIFTQPGKYNEKGIRITGVATAHDEAGGKQRGKNVIFNITVDGLNICHCGDLGHLLTPQQVKEIGHVDVLLIPVGGTYTIGHDQAASVARQLKPSAILPMHYRTPVTHYPIQGAGPFVKAMGGAKKIDSTEIKLNKDRLKDYTGIILLNYC